MAKSSSPKKTLVNDSSGGFLSVDREQALRQNWSEILAMKRPATVSAQKQEKSNSSEQQRAAELKKSAKP